MEFKTFPLSMKNAKEVQEEPINRKTRDIYYTRKPCYAFQIEEWIINKLEFHIFKFFFRLRNSKGKSYSLEELYPLVSEYLKDENWPISYFVKEEMFQKVLLKDLIVNVLTGEVLCEKVEFKEEENKFFFKK